MIWVRDLIGPGLNESAATASIETRRMTKASSGK
jgi:hypothetical protein